MLGFYVVDFMVHFFMEMRRNPVKVYNRRDSSVLKVCSGYADDEGRIFCFDVTVQVASRGGRRTK